MQYESLILQDFEDKDKCAELLLIYELINELSTYNNYQNLLICSSLNDF